MQGVAGRNSVLTVGTVDEVNTVVGTVPRGQKDATELPRVLSIGSGRRDNVPHLPGRPEHSPRDTPVRSASLPSPSPSWLSYPLAQAGAGHIPSCPSRVKKAQGQSTNKHLYLIQFHDIKIVFSPLN